MCCSLFHDPNFAIGAYGNQFKRQNLCIFLCVCFIAFIVKLNMVNLNISDTVHSRKILLGFLVFEYWRVNPKEKETFLEFRFYYFNSVQIRPCFHLSKLKHKRKTKEIQNDIIWNTSQSRRRKKKKNK